MSEWSEDSSAVYRHLAAVAVPANVVPKRLTVADLMLMPLPGFK